MLTNSVNTTPISIETASNHLDFQNAILHLAANPGGCAAAFQLCRLVPATMAPLAEVAP